MSNIIQFPDIKKENLNTVITLLEVCRKMHDEDGYLYTSAVLQKSTDSKYTLQLVLEKNNPDFPDITA